jgi:hypothetical protein
VKRPATVMGPKTEAVIERKGPFILVTWIKRGVRRERRVYEPMMMKLTPALADVLVMALEGGDPV